MYILTEFLIDENSDKIIMFAPFDYHYAILSHAIW